MKQNPDGKTVAAADLLVPGLGELIGGSQREEDIEKLRARMKELNFYTTDKEKIQKRVKDANLIDIYNKKIIS